MGIIKNEDAVSELDILRLKAAQKRNIQGQPVPLATAPYRPKLEDFPSPVRQGAVIEHH